MYNKIKERLKRMIRKELLVELLILVVIFGISVMFASADTTKRVDNVAQMVMLEEWKDADGVTRKLDELPYRSMELSAFVGDYDLSSTKLCFESVDTNFTIMADEKIIYSYSAHTKDILGKSYGMYIHEVKIPSGTRMLRIEAEPIFNDMSPKLANMMIADAGAYMRNVIKEGLPDFCFCFLMLIVGVIMVIVGITGHEQGEFMTLGTFAIIAALWSVNDTMIAQIITEKPSLIRLVNYITFIFVPYPPVVFISKMTHNRKKWIPNGILLLVLINFAVNLSLTISGVSDYHYFVHQGQGIIVAALVAATFLIVAAAKNRVADKKLLWSLIFGAGFTAAGTVIDLIRYNNNTFVMNGIGAYTRLGVFMFLVIVGLYLIQQYNAKLIESNRAEVMMQLAYTDALTGLKNRLAFNEREKQLKSDNTSCIIIQLDINNLKVVNDVYGHSEGDRHITEAAHIIRNSFGEQGDCYRTGGDEFIVVVGDCADEKRVHQGVEKMRQFTDHYNDRDKPPVPLGIAFGIAGCEQASKELEHAERLADKRMYECKYQMKQLAT